MVCHDSNWHQKSMEESWKLATMVNAHLVDDPTIWQPGFTLPRQHWSLLNHFRTGQGHCGACRKTLICAPVVRPKRRPTSSNPALLSSWTVVCLSFTLLIMLLLPSWPTMGLNHIRKKKKKKCCYYHNYLEEFTSAAANENFTGRSPAVNGYGSTLTVVRVFLKLFSIFALKSGDRRHWKLEAGLGCYTACRPCRVCCVIRITRLVSLRRHLVLSVAWHTCITVISNIQTVYQKKSCQINHATFVLRVIKQ